MLISPAYAQDMAGFAATAGQFLPIILIFIVFYFLLIRPQQQAQKTLKAKLAGLKRNDRVITGGGIIGTIAKVRDDSDEIEVEIAQGVRITVLRGTISSVVAPPAAANDAKASDAAKG